MEDNSLEISPTPIVGEMIYATDIGSIPSPPVVEVIQAVEPDGPIEDPTLSLNEDENEERLPVETSNSEFPLVPPNSDSLLVDESRSRFSGASWYEAVKEKTVLLVGLGGIGSHVGFLLSRLSPAHIIMFDPDEVETGNMSGQLYYSSSLGLPKVDALVQLMNEFSYYYATTTYQEYYLSTSVIGDIMICGLDNMEARKLSYFRWKAYVMSLPVERRRYCLFIDGRLAAEEFQVFALQGEDVRNLQIYEDNWLFDSSEAEETLCSYKQTSFMATMIASVIINLFVNFVHNETALIQRDVPFMTSYSADTMFFKVEV